METMTFEKLDYYIGVDVGTGSVRSTITDQNGSIMAISEKPISRKHDPMHNGVINSGEIWSNTVWVVKDVLSKVSTEPCNIRGIGFTATCSLVVMKRSSDRTKVVPYPVDRGFESPQDNIVLWMDHRSGEQTAKLNELLKGEQVLNYIGGGFLSEMAVPKVKYLKENIPHKDWDDIVFFELHDYLCMMATCGGEYGTGDDGSDSNSVFSDKSPHIAPDGSLKGWSSELLDDFGLGDLSKDNFSKIGRVEKIASSPDFCPLPYIGTNIGTLCELSALQLGLTTSVCVAHGCIDCYSGWVGTMGDDITGLSMVAGTSTCFLVAHKSNKFIPGVWGPFSTILPDYFLSEGGQSATGRLIEHLFETHPAYEELSALSAKMSRDVFSQLDVLIDELKVRKNAPSIHHLTKDVFLYGDILGNRTPFNDSSMTWSYIGDVTDQSLASLVVQYIAILEFLALQTKHIVDTMNQGGYDITNVFVSGSQAKNHKLMEILHSISGLNIYVPSEPKYAVVRGASLLACVAYTGKPLKEVMKNMTQKPHKFSFEETNPKIKRLLEVKYDIMKDMAERQMEYRRRVREVIN